jgi:4-amino-4-deoxy-L-arabinose transferase-like glycosyltransferase
VNDGQRFERMLRVVIAAASLGMLAILLFPAYYATPDEAKYIGLGLNVLDGRGLVTVFDVPFPNHSPLWPLALALPQRLVGVDGLAVGHLLNAIAAAAVVALTGVLGWRVRPAAGALAAVVMLAFPFLASNARTAGLDLPSTALTLAFLVVALRAIDRGSTPLALASGVLFGLGFLVKETALPFFPVPFLVALLVATDLVRLARLAAAAVVTAKD